MDLSFTTIINTFLAKFKKTYINKKLKKVIKRSRNYYKSLEIY